MASHGVVASSDSGFDIFYDLLKSQNPLVDLLIVIPISFFSSRIYLHMVYSVHYLFSLGTCLFP